jgi:hypothetical protein
MQIAGVTKPNSFLIETHDVTSVIGICQLCQSEKGLGVIVGRSGFGKSHTLKKYAELENVAYVECRETMGLKDFIGAIERVLGLVEGWGTPYERTLKIEAFFTVHPGYLLIIDEADKLMLSHTRKKLEVIRALYDSRNAGILVSGEPVLEMLIKKHLPMFANRVEFYWSLKGLSRKEVEEYMEGYDVKPDALEELIRRATNTKNGCFRLFSRTLDNVSRLIEPSEPITLEAITKASSMMLL